jgi:hypothetical protein
MPSEGRTKVLSSVISEANIENAGRNKISIMSLFIAPPEKGNI